MHTNNSNSVTLIIQGDGANFLGSLPQGNTSTATPHYDNDENGENTTGKVDVPIMSQPVLWVINLQVSNYWASVLYLMRYYLINCFHSLLNFHVSFCLLYI